MENINSLRPGTILKGEQSYRIESVLGAGGFGITYLAQTSVRVNNISVSVRFAIKEHFISDYCERQADGRTAVCVGTQKIREMFDLSLRDFIAEARRLSAIGAQHDNIVKVNEIIEANDTAYYVMEYLKGKSLWDYIRERGPLTEEEARSLMLPIVDAVAYLHSSNMTHLDIKPQNIMLAEDEFTHRITPVLIDFGMSKHYAQDGNPTSTINTRACSDGYSPIEQYSGITTFSPTADVYALGATILTCLTGRIPTVSTNWPLGEPARTIDALPISEGLKEILKKSMAPAAHGRYTDSRDLYRALNTPQSSDTALLSSETKARQEEGESSSQVQSVPEDKKVKPKGLNLNIIFGKERKNLIVLLVVAFLLGLFVFIFYQRAENSFWSNHINPENLDLAVRRVDGNMYYFNYTEWRNLSSSKKSDLEETGVVVINYGERFILSLDYKTSITWSEAIQEFSNQLPTKEQGQAMASQSAAVSAAILYFGGTVPYIDDSNNWYWTKTECGSDNAWGVSLRFGNVYGILKTNTGKVRTVKPIPVPPII